MARDTIVTPASGLVDFENDGVSGASIQIDASDNLTISADGTITINSNTLQANAISANTITASGVVTADGFKSTDPSILSYNVPSWTNAPEHSVLYNSFKTTLGDYVTLKASGNSTSAHGIVAVADNGIYFGRSNAETGQTVPTDSGTAPLDVNWAYINSTGFVGAGSNITSLNASNISTGTIADARIPSLSASKITSGTFADARIPSLDAAKITSGTFADARIPSLDAAKITSGTFDAARIPNLNASKITAGTLANARLPTDMQLTANAPRYRLEESGVTNTPNWWMIADGGSYSIRLNNTGTYPLTINTNATNDAVSNIVLGYNTSVSGTLTATTFSGSGSSLTNIPYSALTGTPTIPSAAQDSTITITAGTNLTGGGTFTLNQNSNETITINHEDVSAAASVNNSDGNVIQDITLNANGHVTAIGTVNLDGRYYTESELQTFFNRGYISSQGASSLAVGWYTIATNAGDRASARFSLWDTSSGNHQSIHFYATHKFGTDESNDINVISYSCYTASDQPIERIRIKELSTYDGAVLQVYISETTNSVSVALHDNVNAQGWVLKDWIPDATDPGGVSTASNSTNGTTSAYSSFTQSTLVNLKDTIGDGGILTTGKMFAGGQTTQYQVLTTNDSIPTSSLTGDLPSGVDPYITATSTNASYRMVFRNTTEGSGNSPLFSDSAANFYYNPSSNVLTVPTVSGSLSGTATNATNINVAADNSTNATHYPIFTGGATGNQRPNSDTAFTYNPSTNTLTAGTFSGALSGNATTATTAAKASRPTFADDAVAADNITNRVETGFYETSSGTTGEGWPITNNTWQHLIAATHSNNSNYYSMQIAGSFYDQDFYGRKTNSSGTQSWVKFLTSGNYNTYSPTLTGTGATGTWGINITGNAATATTATKWATARTLTLGGALTGSVSIDGSSAISLSAQVVNDSHTHDGRYFTETESDSRYLRKDSYNNNWTRLGYGTTGVAYWHKLAEVTINGAFKDYQLRCDWTDRYNHGTLNIHIHSDNDTTADIWNAYVRQYGVTNRKSINDFKYFKSGSTVQVWIKTPGYREWDYIRKDAVTEGTPTIAWYKEGDAGAGKTTTEPANLVAFTDYSPWHPANDGASSGLNADLLDGNEGSYYLAYGNLTGAPTNISTFTNDSGYITNSGGTTAATANTVAKRDGSADINVRLIRSNYASQSTAASTTARIAFRNDNGASDNYIRTMTNTAFISWLNNQADLDSDTLDGQEGSYYLNYANLTGTPTNISTFTNDSGYLPATLSASPSGSFNIAVEDNYWRWRMGGTGDPAGIRLDAYDTTVWQVTRAGAMTAASVDVSGNSDANQFRINGTTVVDANRDTAFRNVTGTGYLSTNNTDSSRSKFRLYSNSASYAIGMQSAVTFGGLNDWAMTFQMNDESDRGFWWGDTTHTTAQGAMALTTSGRLTVADTIRVGFGETDTTDPGTTYAFAANGNINVVGTVTATGGNSTNWNTAFGWGNHASAGYVTDITTQTDPKYLRSNANDTLSATLKVTGSIIHEYNNSAGYISRPKGAQYQTSSNAVTGAFKIKLPTHGTADMLSFWVDIFDYVTSESISIWIAGYLYQTTNNNEWVNPTAFVLSDNTAKIPLNIRYGADGSNNCVWVGDTNSTWNYPQVTVRDFTAGFTTDIDSYDDNWAITLVTAFDTVDLTVAASGPVTDWTNIENRPTNVSSFTNDAGYLTASSTQSKYLRSDAADTATGLLTLNGGVIVGNSGGTIAGATFDNGWLRIGNSTQGWTFDNNEFYHAGNANIGSLSGTLTFLNRPAFNGGTSGSSSPFTVDSTTVVTNLNADLLDGIDSGGFLRSNATDAYTSGTLTFNSGTTVNIANGAAFNFNRAQGTAPFTVDSTTVVTNLNADLLDGVQGSSYARKSGTDNLVVTKALPKLILDSPGSGDNFTSQGAQISLGESGDGGSAAMHLTYTGDGFGRIGMGTLSAGGVPPFGEVKWTYNSDIIQIPTAAIEIGSGVRLQESTDRADLLQITSQTSGWAGLQIRNSSGEGRWSFMTNDALAGIYDDENNDWHVQWDENGGSRYYYNGAEKLEIASAGIEVTGTIIATGDIFTNTNEPVISGNVTGTLFADIIAANVITADMIQANSIVATLIDADTISANNITTGTLDANDVTITNLSVNNLIGDVSEHFNSFFETPLNKRYAFTGGSNGITTTPFSVSAPSGGIAKRLYISGWLGITKSSNDQRVVVFVEQKGFTVPSINLGQLLSASGDSPEDNIRELLYTGDVLGQGAFPGGQISATSTFSQTGNNVDVWGYNYDSSNNRTTIWVDGSSSAGFIPSTSNDPHYWHAGLQSSTTWVRVGETIGIGDFSTSTLDPYIVVPINFVLPAQSTAGQIRVGVILAPGETTTGYAIRGWNCNFGWLR